MLDSIAIPAPHEPLFPYGTTLKGLNCANEILLSLLMNVHSAKTWREREDALCKSFEFKARKHNHLGITEKMTGGNLV